VLEDSFFSVNSRTSVAAPARHAASLDLSALKIELRDYLDRYPDEQGELEAMLAQVEEETADQLTARSNMRGHLTSSLLVIDNTGEFALLINHGQIGAWIAPGGHVEGDGSLWLSALRETHEETGLPAVLALAHRALLDSAGRPIPLDIDSHPIKARAAKSEGPHCHHDTMYLARAAKPFEPQPQEEEVSGAQWFALSELANLPHERMRKIARKLADLKLIPQAAPKALPRISGF